MEKDFSTWWKEVREDVSAYLQARGDLTKIQAYEKIGKVTGVMISFIVIGILVGFVILFILLMIGSWIAALTDSTSIGISSVAVMMIAILVFLFIKRKTVLEKPVTERVIEALYDEEDFIKHKNEFEENGEEDEII